MDVCLFTGDREYGGGGLQFRILETGDLFILTTLI